jgi:long-subunit fatty acid transport protein
MGVDQGLPSSEDETMPAPSDPRTISWPWHLIVALGLAAGLAAPALAGGFSNLDFGIRRQGMFAVVARPDDGTAIFHNPAGMVLTEGTVFSHHQSWLIGDVRMRLYDSQGRLRPDHEISPDWNLGMIPFLGAVSDLGTERWRLGLAVYAPNVYGAALPADEPTRYHLTRALFVAPRATAAVAFQVTPRLSVAAAVNAIYVNLMLRSARNAVVEADPTGDARFLPYEQLQPTDASQRLDGQAWTWAADVGLLFRPLDGLRLGAAFSGGSSVRLTGTASITEAGGAVVSSRHRTQMVIPFTLRAGINWELAEDFEIGLDVYYWHYQVLQEQRTVFDPPFYGREELSVPKNNSNSFNWCVGLLYRLLPQLDLMMGFQQDLTPTPDSTYTLDNLSRDQLGISAGVRWRINRHWRAGLAGVRNWMNLVNVQGNSTSPPSNVKGHASGSELGLGVEYTL